MLTLSRNVYRYDSSPVSRHLLVKYVFVTFRLYQSRIVVNTFYLELARIQGSPALATAVCTRCVHAFPNVQTGLYSE